jgi:glycosyltransferase involved in cell wall biosynthesis
MAQQEPLVTIMIPTYNQAPVIGRAVESALAQSYRHLEVVVSDDSENDDTAEALRRYLADPRLRYCRNEVRLGRVGNYRRTLYERARGAWVLNVDGDDYLTDARFIEDAVDAVGARSDVVMVAAGQRVAVPGGPARTQVPTREPIEIVEGEQFFLRPFGVFAAAHLSALYRRDLATRLDFYRLDIPSSDRDSLWRLALHGRVLLMGRAVGVWCLHGGNTITSLTAEDLIRNLAAILEPYRCALAAGIDRGRLDAWRDRSLAAYVVSHGPLVAGGRLRDAWAVVSAIRPYRRAYRLAVARLVLDPRALVKWLLLAAGGSSLVDRARIAWRRATWERDSEVAPAGPARRRPSR